MPPMNKMPTGSINWQPSTIKLKLTVMSFRVGDYSVRFHLIRVNESHRSTLAFPENNETRLQFIPSQRRFRRRENGKISK